MSNVTSGPAAASTNESTLTAPPPLWSRLAGGLRGRATPFVIFGVVLLVTAAIAPSFFTAANLTNVSRTAAITGVVAVGMTFVVISGGIDLSVGSVLAVVGVAGALLAQSGMSPVLVVLLGLLIGVGFGLLNGLGVAFLGIQPFIMTLAGLVIARGVALKISGGGPQPFEQDHWLWRVLGNGNIGPVPGPVVTFALVVVIAWLVLSYTAFGRTIYAVGGNPDVAWLSGVKVNQVRIAVYAISGMTAALAGIMTAARLSVGVPTAGNLMELEAIAAVVIGGTTLAGGAGTVIGSVLGAVLLAVLANLLNLLGVDAFDQQIVRGFIIIAAVVITAAAARGGFRLLLNLAPLRSPSKPKN